MTSSPGSTPTARTAVSTASVPLAHVSACEAPWISASNASSAGTCRPRYWPQEPSACASWSALRTSESAAGQGGGPPGRTGAPPRRAGRSVDILGGLFGAERAAYRVLHGDLTNAERRRKNVQYIGERRASVSRPSG